MWYLVLYLVSGLIAQVAMAVHTVETYEELGYGEQFDEASDSWLEVIKDYSGRLFIPLLIWSLICVIVLWPFYVFKAWTEYRKIINTYVFSEDECPEEEES